jgi:hypothetical protein
MRLSEGCIWKSRKFFLIICPSDKSGCNIPAAVNSDLLLRILFSKLELKQYINTAFGLMNIAVEFTQRNKKLDNKFGL